MFPIRKWQHKKQVDSSSHQCNLSLETVIPGLARGTRLLKIRSLENIHQRCYYVNLLTMKLKYFPSTKRLLCKTTPFVDLQDVVEVRTGWKSDVFNQVEFCHKRQKPFKSFPWDKINEDRCFSLVIGSHFETWDLIAPSSNIRDAWVEGLNHLVKICQTNEKGEEFDRWLKKQFRNADLNRNGSLTFSECYNLLSTLNISMNRYHAQILFNKANFRKSKTEAEALDMDEFISFYHLLEARPELEKVFRRYSVNHSLIMGPEELQNFLTKEQKMIDVTLEDCVSLIREHEKMGGDEQTLLRGCLSFRGFKALMLSSSQDLFDSEHSKVNQSMKHPLNHYFIHSSHNTYLRQGQLYGESSMEAYVRALKIGIRCVEIDIWDGPNDEPIVFHGHTLTSKIRLEDVLEVLKEYAFVQCQHPLIISLENHCSLPQQKVAAKLFSTILKGQLYTKAVSKEMNKYPTVEELYGKILLKAKKHNPDDDESSESVVQEALEEEEEHEEVGSDKKTHQTISRQLSELVNICKATRFHSFQEVKENWKFYEMASFSEGTTLDQEMIDYNRVHLSRIYPSGLRTNSSNFMPNLFWSAGCQIVALNVQAYDKGALLNKAMFMENGTCGYVLKPSYLRNESFSYERPLEHATPRKTLVLKVISGQCIPKPGQNQSGEIVDPYVTIKVYGHSLDYQKHKTKYISNNGFNPVWNETFVIKVHFPDLALVVFQVKDESLTGKNKRLAFYALPFNCIAQGYRHIHLWDDLFNPLTPTTLFVHIKRALPSFKSKYLGS